MSRTNRKIHNRNDRWGDFTHSGPEKDCKPGCNVCQRGPINRRERQKKIRQTERLDITRQMDVEYLS